MNKPRKNPAAVALGKIKSPRKAKTSAENGKLGGRPLSPKVQALLVAARAVADCPDYRQIRTHEMATLVAACCLFNPE